jgi:hypothetical protein
MEAFRDGSTTEGADELASKIALRSMPTGRRSRAARALPDMNGEWRESFADSRGQPEAIRPETLL